MNRSGTTGMKLQQGVSFSAPFMKLSKSEAVFWPGCALMNLDGRILERTLEILKREEPHMGVSTCCCGQPSKYLFPEQHEKRQRQLIALLKKKGVKRVYTACPNCAVELRALNCVEVMPIWQVLSCHLKAEDVHNGNIKACAIHDPCPMRNDTAQQQAARKLLALAGIEVTEPEHSGEKTICCGNFHMMQTIDPAKSRAMRRRRLNEFSKDAVITSYCAGCLDAFRSEGRKAAHLLELLFGVSEAGGWKNRILYTVKSK